MRKATASSSPAAVRMYSRPRPAISRADCQYRPRGRLRRRRSDQVAALSPPSGRIRPAGPPRQQCRLERAPVPLEEVTFEQWNGIVAANLTGAFLCTQHAFRLMKAQTPRGGRIINNGSISAQTPRPNSAPYTRTKHAITGLTKSTALDGRMHDIGLRQIDIGNAATDMTARMSTGVLQANGEVAAEPTIPIEHIAEAVVYMASLPLSANVLTMTVMATQDAAGRRG